MKVQKSSKIDVENTIITMKEELKHHVEKSNSGGLDKHADPFAPRAGKTLVWKNVNMVLKTKSGEPDRKLLDNVWGEVPARETTAIMGPSGSGKSSLLNVLAGRAKSNGHITITSDVRFNNYRVDPTNIRVRQLIAFVAQDDSLQVTSTPREAIYFSAKLRLPRTTTDDQLHKLTERMLQELGLVDCADTIVGGVLIKGISGGQRKRTSVGVELVTRPALVFLDEPTSGLDSYSAVQLCQVLKKVANAGSSVLFTIHQPSSEIFNSFDHLILLNKGRVMYEGEVTNVPMYFGERGRPNPPNYNPADWIMNVAQSVPLAELEAANFFPKDERVMGDAFEPEKGSDVLGLTVTRRFAGGCHDDHHRSCDHHYQGASPGIGTQVRMLFQREVTNLVRDVTALGARFGLSLFIATLIGIIFYKVGEEDRTINRNIQSQFGAIMMVSMMGMFGTAQPALLSFPEERPVFLREYSTNHYSVVSYFISRLSMEAFITGAQVLIMIVVTHNLIGFTGPFGMYYLTTYTLAMASTALGVALGCSVDDAKLATEFLPIIFVPQMLFAGFFVSPDLIPQWLRWARYGCSLTYAVRLLLVAEFEECGKEQRQDMTGPQSCNFLLMDTDAHPDETWWNWIVLVALFAFFRILALAILRHKATQFY